MVNPSVSVWTIARFEFMRYFKWKHELINVVILMILMLISAGGGALMEAAKNKEHYDIAVIGHSMLPLEFGKPGRLTLLRAEASERDARWQDVDAKRLDGLLILNDDKNAELFVNREPSWRKELDAQLSAARLSLRLQQHQITRDEFDSWQKSPTIDLQFTPNAHQPASERSQTIAFALVIFSILAVMTSFTLFFVSITTEKQQRVSEMIVSSITPQMWLDGKLLGLSGHGIKSIFTMSLYGVAGAFAISRLSGNDTSVLASLSFSLIVIAFLFSLAGLFFWNSFMAAIAASIDDPNSSTRSALMMLPMLFIMMVFPGIDSPENLMMKMLSWLPMTSLAAMPVRIAHGVVSAWEIAGSFTVLLIAIFYFRRMATRVFEAGMLMYGKEASWRELWRWARFGAEH